MVQIHRVFTVTVPSDFAFSYITELTNLPEWLYGLQSIRAASDVTSGVGDRYDGVIKLGTTLHSTIEVTEYEAGQLFGTESRSGIISRASWRFRALNPQLTEIDVFTSYELPGGIPGRVIARAIEPIISVAAASSEHSLRTILTSRYQDTTRTAER